MSPDTDREACVSHQLGRAQHSGDGTAEWQWRGYLEAILVKYS